MLNVFEPCRTDLFPPYILANKEDFRNYDAEDYRPDCEEERLRSDTDEEENDETFNSGVDVGDLPAFFQSTQKKSSGLFQIAFRTYYFYFVISIDFSYIIIAAAAAATMSLADLEGELGIPTFHRRGTPPGQRHPAAAAAVAAAEKNYLSVDLPNSEPDVSSQHPPGFSPKTERAHNPQHTTNPQLSNLVCCLIIFAFFICVLFFCFTILI